jgi:hypothetical protein
LGFEFNNLIYKHTDMSYPAPPIAPSSAPFSDYSAGTNGSSPVSSSLSSSYTTSMLVRGVLIVLLLALLGFNVFTYLDDIAAWFGETFGAPFRSVARYMGYAATDTAQTTVDVAAQGTKSAVDIAAGAASSGIGVLQQTIGQRQGSDQHQQDQNMDQPQPGQSQQQPQGQDQSQQGQQQQPEMSSNAGLQRALSHAKKESPQPDDATSRTQRQHTGKSGYCYIGEDRGFRSCIKVGEEDTCMSGDIFPTQAICINPRLRK